MCVLKGGRGFYDHGCYSKILSKFKIIKVLLIYLVLSKDSDLVLQCHGTNGASVSKIVYLRGHQAIAWFNIDAYLVRSCDIHQIGSCTTDAQKINQLNVFVKKKKTMDLLLIYLNMVLMNL